MLWIKAVQMLCNCRVYKRLISVFCGVACTCCFIFFYFFLFPITRDFSLLFCNVQNWCMNANTWQPLPVCWWFDTLLGLKMKLMWGANSSVWLQNCVASWTVMHQCCSISPQWKRIQIEPNPSNLYCTFKVLSVNSALWWGRRKGAVLKGQYSSVL